MARYLDGDAAKLYELIWKRAVASQMECAEQERTTVDVVSADKKITLRATGTVTLFDGFLTLYLEGQDDAIDEDGSQLPKVAAGDATEVENVTPAQHFTEPPPRYSEASLVKKLEELGIGRPSTYASILSTLRDRAYVRMDRERFIPKTRAGWSPPSCKASSSAMSNMTSPPTWKRSSTKFPPASWTGSSCCAISGRISPPRSARPRISRSAR